MLVPDGIRAQAVSTAAIDTLPGSIVTFTWTGTAGARSYLLMVGTALGKGDIFNQNLGLALSQTVTGIPTDGSLVYVKVLTEVGSPPNTTWNWNNSIFRAASTDGAAEMISPAPGTILSGSSVQFSWTNGWDATSYILMMDTTKGQGNLLNHNVGTATSQLVNQLPTNGATIYVSLWTVQGTVPYTAMVRKDYVYTAAGGGVFTGTGATLPQSAPASVGPTAITGLIAGSGAAGLESAQAQALADQLAAALGSAGITLSPDAINQLTGAIAKGGQTAVAVALAVAQSLAQIPADQGSQGRPGSAPPSLTSTLATPVGGLSVPGQSSGTSTAAGTSLAVSPPRKISIVQPVPSAGTPSATSISRSDLAAMWGMHGSPTAALFNFPVLGGAVRSSFSSSRVPSSWQERAYYSVALTPDIALNTYALQLASAGWSETSRTQTGDASAQTLQFTVDLQNGPTHAHLVYAQNHKPGTSVSLALTTPFAGESATSLSTGVTAAPATGAASSPLDHGPRDPPGVPRLPGSVRTSDSTSTYKGVTQEFATYTAACRPASAEAYFIQNLPAGGWEEFDREEQLNDLTMGDQITLKWQSASATAVIALNGSTAGGTDVRVAITNQTAAP